MGRKRQKQEQPRQERSLAWSMAMRTKQHIGLTRTDTKCHVVIGHDNADLTYLMKRSKFQEQFLFRFSWLALVGDLPIGWIDLHKEATNHASILFSFLASWARQREVAKYADFLF